MGFDRTKCERSLMALGCLCCLASAILFLLSMGYSNGSIKTPTDCVTCPEGYMSYRPTVDCVRQRPGWYEDCETGPCFRCPPGYSGFGWERRGCIDLKDTVVGEPVVCPYKKNEVRNIFLAAVGLLVVSCLLLVLAVFAGVACPKKPEPKPDPEEERRKSFVQAAMDEAYAADRRRIERKGWKSLRDQLIFERKYDWVPITADFDADLAHAVGLDTRKGEPLWEVRLKLLKSEV